MKNDARRHAHVYLQSCGAKLKPMAVAKELPQDTQSWCRDYRDANLPALDDE
jgi:hypothetical protein